MSHFVLEMLDIAIVYNLHIEQNTSLAGVKKVEKTSARKRVFFACVSGCQEVVALVHKEEEELCTKGFSKVAERCIYSSLKIITEA